MLNCITVCILFTMEGGDSEFANFTLPTLKAFLEARTQNVSIIVCSCYRMPHLKTHFFHEIATFWSAKTTLKRRRQKHFFPTPHPLSPVIFATATVVTFVLLRNSRFNFHCYPQREATRTQIGPEVTLRPIATSCAKDYKGHSLVQASFTEPPSRYSVPLPPPPTPVPLYHDNSAFNQFNQTKPNVASRSQTYLATGFTVQRASQPAAELSFSKLSPKSDEQDKK